MHRFRVTFTSDIDAFYRPDGEAFNVSFVVNIPEFSFDLAQEYAYASLNDMDMDMPSMTLQEIKAVEANA
jgi:hypothetical protein